MVATPVVTRQPRSETTLPALNEIEARHEDGGTSTPDDGTKGPTPEEALAEAQRLIAAKDEELARKDVRIATAEAEAAKAGKTAVDAREAQIRDQGAAMDNAISAAEGRRAAATAKFKEARANNDAGAEADAMAEISEAGAELANAKSNKTRFETWKENAKRQPAPEAARQQSRPGQNQAVDGPTPESLKWLGDHPRYYADQGYQAEALAASNRAISLNIPEGSKPYVDFIDAELEKIFGKNHGQIDRKGPNVTQDSRKPRQQPNRSSSAAPPSRGGDEYRGGGDFEYVHGDGSRLRLVQGVGQDGKPFESVQGTIPAQWREFAKVNRMTDVAYAVEMLKVEQQKQPGGDYEGLDSHQNGVYRA